jgi:hypothetical protein
VSLLRQPYFGYGISEGNLSEEKGDRVVRPIERLLNDEMRARGGN